MMGQTASGWARLMVVVVFLCGVILMSMGMLGLYVGRGEESSGDLLFWLEADRRPAGRSGHPQDADTRDCEDQSNREIRCAHRACLSVRPNFQVAYQAITTWDSVGHMGLSQLSKMPSTS